MIKKNVLLIIALLLAWTTSWALPKDPGLYLSFEQRLAISYALLAQGEAPAEREAIFDRAQNYYAQVLRQKVETVEVANFQEFLDKSRGQWPNTHSLELDLQIVEKGKVFTPTIYTSKSARVQRQIDAYQEWQQKELLKVVQSPELKNHLEAAKPLLTTVNAQPSTIKSLIIEMSDSVMGQQLKKLDHIGEAIATSSLAQQQDEGVRLSIQTMMTEYFSRLNLSTKKLIVSSYLGGDLRANDLKKFEIMVQNSGPQLQKLLQVVARQSGIAPEMLEVFKNLENSVRPVPWTEVEKILAREKGNYEFIYFEKKPLGVGTMAQVHRAKILVNGERRDVVVRFMKPEIQSRVEEDRRVLTEVAKILDSNPAFRKTGAPLLAPLIDDITATVTAELDQNATIERQKLAKQRYEKESFIKAGDYKNVLEFHVPHIFTPARSSQLMVQEMVIGKKLDKEVAMYGAQGTAMKKAMVEEVAKLWAAEVMFGSGFYHSDLHQGNFMVRITDPKITFNILDFGMGGTMSAELQRQVMVLFAGTELNKPDLIASAFWGISEKSRNTINETQLRTLIAAKSAKIAAGKEPPLSFELWTAWALDQGLKLPYDFIGLNRGMVIIDKLLEESKSSLRVSTSMKSLARNHPMMVYRRLVTEGGLSHRDLLKLGWIEMRSMMRPLPIVEKPVSVLQGLRCEKVFP